MNIQREQQPSSEDRVFVYPYLIIKNESYRSCSHLRGGLCLCFCKVDSFYASKELTDSESAFIKYVSEWVSQFGEQKLERTHFNAPSLMEAALGEVQKNNSNDSITFNFYRGLIFGLQFDDFSEGECLVSSYNFGVELNNTWNILPKIILPPYFFNVLD